MAAIDQINVNIGTEQSPNYVLHDVNDKRISSTAVTTATHLLATDASLSAINPMTIANAASVLGASGALTHLKNIIKSESVTIHAGETVKLNNTLSGIIIISSEGSYLGTIIAATIYGNANLVNIGGSSSIDGITISKEYNMADLQLSNSKSSGVTLRYTFISSGSQYNIP